MRNVVRSLYCGIDCIVVQSSRMKPSTLCADCRTRSYLVVPPLVGLAVTHEQHARLRLCT